MRPPPLRTFFLTWTALLVLLALTLASAYVSMGPWNSIINMAIAAAKTLLVALYFMHLARASVLRRLVAAAALFTLALLFVLSGADYATRHISPVPSSAAAVR